MSISFSYFFEASNHKEVNDSLRRLAKTVKEEWTGK